MSAAGLPSFTVLRNLTQLSVSSVPRGASPASIVILKQRQTTAVIPASLVRRAPVPGSAGQCRYRQHWLTGRCFRARVKFVTVEATDRSAKIPTVTVPISALMKPTCSCSTANREKTTRSATAASIQAFPSIFMMISSAMCQALSGHPSGCPQHTKRLNALEENDRISDILASATIEPTIFSLSWSGRFHPRDLTLNETKLAARSAMAAPRQNQL